MRLEPQTVSQPCRLADLQRIETSPPSSWPDKRDSSTLIYSSSAGSSGKTNLSPSNVDPSLRPFLVFGQRSTTLAAALPAIPGLYILDKMSSTFTLLDPNAEDDLHAKRLLNIEEKSFKRIQKRLLTPSNPIQEFLRRKPVDRPSTTRTNPDETLSEAEAEQDKDRPSAPQTPSEISDYLTTLANFHQSTIHDFTSLTHSLARLQFLLSSNDLERARYTTQASTITSQQSAIRAETSSLRTRLSEARDQLQVRKGYDVLAEKVLWVDGKVGGTKAKTRAELGRECEKLKGEIEELEREGDELVGMWADRRRVLGEVGEEAARLRRVVRGEVDVIEDDQEQDQEHDTDRNGDAEGDDPEHTQKRRDDDEEHNNLLDLDVHDGGLSNVGTPRPHDDDGATTPMPGHHSDSRPMTPLPTTSGHDPTTFSDAATPISHAGDQDPEGDDDQDMLMGVATPDPGNPGFGSSLNEEGTLPTPSPHPDNDEEDEDENEDENENGNESDFDMPEIHIENVEKDQLSEMDDS